MRAAQQRLFPDPQPLVERLGPSFFRQVPSVAGVYLMQDRSGSVLYVGKAKNLRHRLNSYRVANPDRLPRRTLRLLRLVEKVECEECADESSALAREAVLLRSLQPRFNRAGVWPAPPRFLAWRVVEEELALALAEEPLKEWHNHGPLAGGARHIRTTLVRLLWCGLQPERHLLGMPPGWFRGRLADEIALRSSTSGASVEEAATCLVALAQGSVTALLEWAEARVPQAGPPFLKTVLMEDLDLVTRYFQPKGLAPQPPC